MPRSSLPYQEAHDFVQKLAGRTDNDGRALWLVTYTGARYIEAAAACWKEFDLQRRIWTIPPDRMKKRHIHEIPLPRQVVAFLEALPGDHHPDDLVFPSREGTPVANSRVNDVLRDLGYQIGEASTHGFRSTLRTWVGDTYKDIKKEIAESVIAHDKRSGVEQTCERTRFLKDRRPIMQAWADYLDAPPPADEDSFLAGA
ncbi:site-specific integrase [Caballeronia ptereochthonis]|uniref:Phage integrase n=1 Tax=Caballeronia ptereochthonis TaxID=1777144 RepID=A0A157ZKI6_9BURK|nr:site-specific integrase [Caballeronia ptereochthonis]SAK46023.1 phage integrase [Caballeronia ptereochthonis]